MNDINTCIVYSLSAFIVAFIAASSVNLLKQHFVIQLSGLTFLFISAIVKSLFIFINYPDISVRSLIFSLMPILSCMSACLTSMVLGFLIFPGIRRKIK